MGRSRIDATLKETSSVLSSISSSSSSSLFRPIEPNPPTVPRSLLSLRPVPVTVPTISRLNAKSEPSDQNLVHNLATHRKTIAPKILLPQHPFKNIQRK